MKKRYVIYHSTRPPCLDSISPIALQYFLSCVCKCKFFYAGQPVQAFEKGETGLRANCLHNILEQELQRNPFDGFFYPLNSLSIGVLLGSTQVRFRATLPQNIHNLLRNNMIFFIVILHSKQKTLPRSFIEVVQSLKPTQCSCVLAGCMILMFSKSLTQSMLLTRRCPKN